MKSIAYKVILAIFFCIALIFAVFYSRYLHEGNYIYDLPELEPPSVGASEDAPWIELFDGVSLKGWKVKIKGESLGNDRRETFRVENKNLSIDYENYDTWEDSFGHLFYSIPYSHYILKLEYRFIGEQLADARKMRWAWRNSGVMVHAQSPDKMALNQDFPVSIEVQLLGASESEARSTGNLCTPGTHVRIDNRLITQHCINSSSYSFLGYQWVELELEVRGNNMIRHFINGGLVMQYSSPELDTWSFASRKTDQYISGNKNLGDGYIAIQSESHPVQFRNIKLLPLL